MAVYPPEKQIELNYYPVSMEEIDVGVPSPTNPQANTPAVVVSPDNVVPAAGGSILKDGFLQSPNFVSGASGWQLNSNGIIKAVGVIISGAITAITGLIGGWTISALAIFKDGTTDAESAGLAPADYPFYAGKKYADRATAPFRVTPDGQLVASDIIATGTINAQAGYLGNGVYIDTVNGLLVESEGLNVGTAGHIRGGQTVYNTGIGFFLGYSTNAYKFSIGNSAGNYLTWNGSILGIKGAITGSTITGATITGSTLQTGTTGNNVNITAGRISQRYNEIEVVYSDVGTYGGFWGFKDIDGNSAFYIDIEGAGTAHTIGFRGQPTNSGDWYFDCKGDIYLIGGTGHDFVPINDNQVSLGWSNSRWADVRSVLINGADYCFENGVRITEERDFGISFYNSEDKKIMTLDKDGNIWIKGEIKQNTDMKKEFSFYRKGLLIKE